MRTAPVPGHRLETSDVGTVVHVYPDGKAFEIELMTLIGETAVATADASVVRLVAASSPRRYRAR
jgi:Domain of unknown function (DUF4926)